MGSGLIYAIIVVLWAIVLVPMWLRRHDAETESRSVDRFSSAMKVLSRRPRGRRSVSEPRSLVVPPPAVVSDEPLDVDSPADGAERPAYLKPSRRPVSAPAAPVFVSRPAPRGSADQHQRRRRILLGLGVLLLAAGIVFALGIVPLAVPLVAFAVVAGYLALIVSSAASTRRAAEAQRRQQLRERSRGGVVQASTAWHDTIVLGNAPATSSLPQELAGTTVAQQDGAGWQPTPIPVPTYVNAPAASVLPREIDRRHDGAWDAQGMLDQAAAVRADAEAARSREIDAHPDRDDVWTRATAPSAGRDEIFDREWFESDFDGTSAEQIAQDDAAGYLPRRRAVNE